MHPNIVAIIWLSALPLIVTLIVLLLLWAIRKKFPRKTLIVAGFMALWPAFMIVNHYWRIYREMSEMAGVYYVVYAYDQNGVHLPEHMDIELFLDASGTYTFNNLPCGTGSESGNWKWSTDLIRMDISFSKRDHCGVHFNYSSQRGRLIFSTRGYRDGELVMAKCE